MKKFTSCVALLADQVRSRSSDRPTTHPQILRAIDVVNEAVQPLDLLRVTVGDEMQGIYRSAGDALHARYLLQSELTGVAELRFGIGFGDVEIIDDERGIQDGSAWWRAREAIEEIEELAQDAGLEGLRTGIRDDRPDMNPLIVPTIRLIDAQFSRLREGARESLRLLLAGHDNQTAAKIAGISPSANSQRVINNDLRILQTGIDALSTLP